VSAASLIKAGYSILNILSSEEDRVLEAGI
jgi:hypothetical protein